MSGARVSRKVVLATLAIAAFVGVPASPATAAECPAGSAYSECGAGWEVNANAYPTTLAPGGTGLIAIDVLNIGAVGSTGPVTVTDTLPEGLEATEAGEASESIEPEAEPGHELWQCAGTKVVTCTNDMEHLRSIAGGGGNPTIREGGTNYNPIIAIKVRVAPTEVTEAQAKADPNRVTVAGGGALSSASSADPITVSATPPAHYQFVGWDGWASNANGTIDTQAGSHPYEISTVLDLASAQVEGRILSAGGETRNVEVNLPSGLVGNPNAIQQCTRQQLLGGKCPTASQVGIQTITFASGRFNRERLWNMVPPPGVAAEFGASTLGISTSFAASVRVGGDYGVNLHIDNVPERQVTAVVDTFWGVPSDPSHDPWRSETDGGCKTEELEEGLCSAGQKPTLKPYLTLPTACGKELPWRIQANTWLHPDETSEATFYTHDSNGQRVALTGCEDLSFDPTIALSPETAQADTATGLVADVRPPVGGLEDPEGFGTSDVQNTTVTLPEGLVVNPGQAAGLQACKPGDVEGGDDLPLPGEQGEAEQFSGPTKCPRASKIGTVKITSPLIEGDPEKELEGNVYLLQSDPPEIKLLVAASADGVNVKLIGVVHLDEQTGRLTTTFEGTPQLPFTDFRLVFEGGAKAALDTPTECGTYTTNADFTPWSSPFTSDLPTAASFAVTEGPGGGACPPAPLPFAPTLVAGTSTGQAGGFASFSTLIQRGDGQQRVESFQFKSPAGLAGLISSVPLCPEPQAAQGSCPGSSEIGHALTTSGPGPDPLTIPQPGDPAAPIYLTGPYRGAPFGLSIVTPVIAGPFNLGTIVTRAKIEVDPRTAEVTVTTDPLPQIVKGVPTDLRSIYAVIDRPGFFFNPTNCTRQQFSGTATSVGGVATAALSSGFAASGCRELTFAPTFTASTQGNGNFNDNGASLDVKIATHQGPSASPAVAAEANIAKVDVQLPLALPSRLTTLQKACTEAQFAADPAGCPAASDVGTAVAHTPVLPVPLVGPAYLVSHGGEAFPDLDIVLQGDGVTIDLVGHTQIRKGITYSHFDTVPDAPVSSFELNLPEGRYSALAAITNLCKPTSTKTVKKRVALTRNGKTVRRDGTVVYVTRTVKEQVAAPLQMPTTITAQNGAVITQTTKIAVTGCPTTRAPKTAKHTGTTKKSSRKAAKAGAST
jgi:hypothetical protein